MSYLLREHGKSFITKHFYICFISSAEKLMFPEYYETDYLMSEIILLLGKHSSCDFIKTLYIDP